jgi:hypothetical protein
MSKRPWNGDVPWALLLRLLCRLLWLSIGRRLRLQYGDLCSQLGVGQHELSVFAEHLHAMDAWAHQRGVKLVFSRPGTPTDNPFIEAFNGRLRQECLNQYWFFSIEEARTTLEDWRNDYNTIRPHTALGNQTPAAFHAAWGKQQANAETG